MWPSLHYQLLVSISLILLRKQQVQNLAGGVRLIDVRRAVDTCLR
jgi:hypothetical protein